MMKAHDNLMKSTGLSRDGAPATLAREEIHNSLLLKLAAHGFPLPGEASGMPVMELSGDLFKRYAEQSRRLSGQLAPPDERIQAFLDATFARTGEPRVTLPDRTLIVDRHGLARELSLPALRNEYHNQQVSSYRLRNGVLHNPENDRRTTKGVFHVADFGFPVPADKTAVPLLTYQRLLAAALAPPPEMLELPFTADWESPVRTMVSLLLRPLVIPKVPGVRAEQRMEIRFFAPGGLVANLDFVESIFGNAGDPHLPENNAALDPETWTGHSGCVIVAPHLRSLKKKDLGLPHVSEATEKQRAAGMCFLEEDELYNGGKPFKITLRDQSGIMVTILADNYFGYCKKEVKTQIGLSANISGLAEEEHAGGALAFPSSNLGSAFLPDALLNGTQQRIAEVAELLGDTVKREPQGYLTDKEFPHIHIMPEDMAVELSAQEIRWTHQGRSESLRLLPGHFYLHPSGYKVRLEKHDKAPSWRLIGTMAEGTFVHKPCTVSGGGKSEISKSLTDAVLYGPIYIGDFESDLDCAERIIERDYSGCIKPELREAQEKPASRKVLSSERSLGSVIKLLTPNESVYTEEHNEFVNQIPNHVRAIVFAIKRFYREDWNGDWRSHFSVDLVNGAPGHELKLDGRTLVGSYLRVGRWKNGAWRNYKLRQDFIPAAKVQMEDDITASIVVPASQLEGLPSGYDGHPSLKIAENCEFRLFQRPDDAIVPGFDKQTERDMAGEGLFASNFAPLSADEMRDITERVDVFEHFSPEMKAHMLASASESGPNVCSARPRLVGGVPTKNPRYLQVRPDLRRPEERYLAELGARLHRRIPIGKEIVFPVQSVMSGRRNNPPDEIDGKKIRPLCVFNPIHYQELPELFMDYICSVTGKSPSTTGAGSEGALTKGPFNAIFATADLNNTLVSMLLTGYAGFSTAAGYIGPDVRVDHDISLLIPEIWCRLLPSERDPANLIRNGYLEKVDDFEHEGKTVPASRLGYRITERFVHAYFGRVFDNPSAVLSHEILKPESQDLDVFVDGVLNLAEAQKAAAEKYFEDGSIKHACPPLRALLHIMVSGTYEGKDIQHPDIRKMFTREELLSSDWYQQRLFKKQERDVVLWSAHVKELERFLKQPGYSEEAARLSVSEKLEAARQQLEHVSSPGYLDEILGTIGADPIDSALSAPSEKLPNRAPHRPLARA